MRHRTQERRLIVTADDLGASVAVNKAIVHAADAGILRFASLMVGGEAADDAVERVRRQAPSLGIGLHVVLSGGKSLLGPEKLGNMVDARGWFHPSSVRCGFRYFFDSSTHRRIELEMRAQFERFLALGFAPTHVDGHMHMHVHPIVFPMMMRLSREYGFSRIRLPGGELPASLAQSFRRGGTPLWKQLTEGLTLEVMKRYLWRCHGDPRMRLPDRVYGQLQSGLMKENYIVSFLRSLPAGVTEVYFHPSLALEGSEGGGMLSHGNEDELSALTSADVREALASSGILLEGPGLVG